MVRVRDLVDRRELGLEVLTGADRLDRELRWVHVTELADACRRLEMPLLVLPIEVPFTAVSEAMAELQAEARQRELLRSITRGNTLAQAVAEGADERGVLRLLVRDLALPVAVVDAGGRVLAAEGVD